MKSTLRFISQISLGVLLLSGGRGIAQTTSSMIQTPPTVLEMMDSFLLEKDWGLGFNEVDGKTFIVVQGTAVIGEPTKREAYGAARKSAYDRAMLEAKQKVAEFLAVEITSNPLNRWNVSSPNSIGGLLSARLMVRLKSDLDAKGIDIDAFSGGSNNDLVKEIVKSERYSKLIRTTAQAEVIGVQAFCTFESINEEGKPELGVIAVWSPRLHDMASSMVTGFSVAPGQPKTQIRKQVRADNATLLSSFGVRLLADEKGDWVLVAYGQGESKGKAGQMANSMLREFAGEVIAVAKVAYSAETFTEYENKQENYSLVSTFHEMGLSIAESLSHSGMLPVYEARIKHPKTGSTIYLSVMSWSLKNMGLAVEMISSGKGNFKASEGYSSAVGIPSDDAAIR